MSQTIPPFAQYQQPMFPLRGLWNAVPAEGDKFVSVYLDWSTINASAVQFALAGNSPVAISQIVALVVDNSRCGADIDFLFPDSGFVLSVPAYNGGVFPVFTNALMFYAVASQAPGSSGITVFQILNSMPPPVAIAPSSIQNSVTETGVPLHTVGNTYVPVLPAPTSGRLTGFQISWSNSTDTSPTANLDIIDGTTAIKWAGTIEGTSGQMTVNNMNVRFSGGLQLGILGSDYSSGTLFITLFYTSP